MTVLKKELLDMLRDRRTIITGILLPVILYPLMFGIMGSSMENMEKEVFESTTVSFIGAKANEAQDLLAETFAIAEGVSIISSANPVKALEDGDIKVLIRAEDGGELIQLSLIYDENKMSSSNSMNYVSEIVNAFNNAVVQEKLHELGINMQELYPTAFGSMTLNAYIEETTGEKVSNGSGGMMLGMMVPMMLVVILATGGMSAAVDLFAGEKERKTFEPLLTTRAGRFPVMMGKFMAVNCFAAGTAIMMVVGMVGGFLINPSMITMGMGENINLSLPIGVILLAVLLVLLMTLIFSGIHVAISTWSRTIKEASSYSTFIMLAAMIPSFVTMYMQAGDVELWMMAVPVLNVIGALKIVLAGMLQYNYILVAIASSAAFLAIVLGFTLNLFKKEQIMFRT